MLPQAQFGAVAVERLEKLDGFLGGLQGAGVFPEQARQGIVLALDAIVAASALAEHDHEGHDHADGEPCALPREPQQLVDDDRRFYGDLKRVAAGEPGAAATLMQRYGLSRESVDALLRRLGATGTGPTGAEPLVADSLALADTFRLHSNPGVRCTIYLDFNGHVTSGTSWNSSYNNGADIISPAYDPERNGSNFSDTELVRIQQIWARVAEDFAPFDVNVTTEDPGAAALSKSGSGDASWGIRVVISPDQSWIQDDLGYAIGGIAYINSFNSSTDTPTFVFNSSEIGVSAAVSHEVGHSLGLSHDGTTSANPLQPSEAYYDGHGSGETDWGPIMGTGYYANVTQWDRGEYIGANNTGAGANYNRGADDLAVITTYNGFGYRPDDHANNQLGASAVSVLGVNAANASLLDVSQFGMIQGRTDTDWFSFQTGTGVVNITIDSYVSQGWISNGGGSYSWFLEPTFYSTSWSSNQGSNLDIQARIYDANGALVATSNPLGLSAAFTNLSLNAGTYFIEIDGINYGEPSNPTSPTGYSDYGSIGEYAIKGTVQAGGPVASTYALNSSASSVDEGGTVTFTATTTGVTAGTVLAWKITGVSGADLVGGQTQGTFTVGGDGRAIESLTLLADLTAEGAETLIFTVYDASGVTALTPASSVVVNDTSKPDAPLTLWGTTGSDVITGGSNNDRLAGVPASGTRGSSMGKGQIDTITGGLGADIFLVADSRGTFYNDGSSKSQGLNDYVLIKDFNAAEGDRLQLRVANQYWYRDVGGTREIYLADGIAGFGVGDELVARLEGAGIAGASSTAQLLSLSANWITTV
jgi:hypothetical protein